MKPVTISSDSWHYKLVNKIYGRTYAKPENICDYTQKFLFSIFSAFIIGAFCLALTISMGDTLAWVASMIMTLSTFEPNGVAVLGIVGIGVILFFMVVAGVTVLAECLHDVYHEKAKESVPVAMIKSFTQKFCIPVKVE